MNHSSETIDDARLVARLRAIVTTGATAANVEESIGKPALVNTTSGFPLDGLRRVNFVADPDHPTETLELATARAVVYWARSPQGEDPRVVGIQFANDGAASVFFAQILPP